MADRATATGAAQASSTGQAFTGPRRLDLDVETCRPEYEAMLSRLAHLLPLASASPAGHRRYCR